MASAKSTTKRPPAPYSREGRYQATVALLRDRILPSSGDLFEFSDTQVAEDKELFSLGHLRTCVRVPLPDPPSPPPRRLPTLKACPTRRIKIGLLPREHLPGVPFMRLAGRWLEQAGFQIGTSACVRVEEQRLVIEADPAQCVADTASE
jgi:hypothetical protein